MSPVGKIFTDMHTALEDNEASNFISDAQRWALLRGIFIGYYGPGGPEVAFDTNRRWCGYAALLEQLFPKSKIICCVRTVPAIVDSLERLQHKHPLRLSTMVGYRSNTTIYDRLNEYMGPGGVVGFAFNGFRQAWHAHRDRLLIVQYDDLARFPVEIMRDIHLALELEPFTYDMENIRPLPGVEEFDDRIGTPGLHTVHSKIVYEPRAYILPPDVIASLPAAFWLNKPVTPAP